MDQKKAPSSRIEALQSIKTNHTGNDATTQAKRLLAALQSLDWITTLEARRHLDILAPAARVFELRNRQNQNIVSTWDYAFTDAGVKHRIGRYTLIGLSGRENAKP